MAMKWRPQANEESYEALQSLFLRVATDQSELIDSDGIWRQTVSDPWFAAEIRLQVARLIAGDDPLRDDTVQQVVVHLRAKLSKRKDLGADAHQLRTSFPAWMGNIIRNACIDFLRQEWRHLHNVLTESDAAENPVLLDDLRLDMAEAISRLEPREREVAHCMLREMTSAETAESLQMSERQMEGSLKKVVRLLKRLLAVYRNSR
jgi:RNA polymerase sigma factor (sigma-70 family)